MLNHLQAVKLNIQKVVILVTILLFGIKLLAYWFTGSVSILSDALESTVNLMTSVATFYSLRYAFKPRDEDHPYGHGKIELITASVEGALIGLAGLWIIFESVHRLWDPQPVTEVGLGLLLVALSGLINFVLAKYSLSIGKKYNSVALISGGKHLMTDTYTSMGLILGLILMNILPYTWLDSVIAIFFALFILRSSYEIISDTVNGLMDESDLKRLEHISNYISSGKPPQWVYLHKLTFLKFGDVVHLDMHLTLPFFFSLRESEQEIRQLKTIIKSHMGDQIADISIQAEPCLSQMCGFCRFECSRRKNPFEKEFSWDLMMMTGNNMFSDFKSESFKPME